MLHHHTASLQHRNVTRKKPRHFLKALSSRGGEVAKAPRFLMLKQGKMEVNVPPRSNLCPGRGLGRGDKREARPRPLVALAEQLLSTFASYRYTCASALSKAAFCNRCQTNRNKEVPSLGSHSADSNENKAF